MFSVYKVGERVPELAGHQEGVCFDLSDGGAILYVFFNNPTEHEIEQFSCNQNFEIRFTEIHNVIVLTVKVGDLNWMDAPYTPHLSGNLTKFELPSDGIGLALTIMLVNGINGEVKSIRLLGLSESFTRSLIGTIMDQKMTEFNKVEYDKNVNDIFRTYTTKEIVKMSKNYCKM